MRRLQPLVLLIPLAATAACGAAAGARASVRSTASPPSATAPVSSTAATAPATTPAAPTSPTATGTLQRTLQAPVPRRTPTPAALPPFASSAAAVTAADLGATWHAGCPVAPDQLRLLSVSYDGFDGLAHTGEIVVAASRAAQVVAAFADLYAHRFPIRSMITVDRYGGSDDASVAADNTAGFNCRAAVGGDGSWSMHAYGEAIDVDPVENPYLYDGTVDPPDGAAYANRSDVRPGMAVSGGELVEAFARVGWRWGATFGDYQHFSTNGK